MQQSPVQYSTVQYSTVQYSTVGGGPHHVQEAASTHRDLGRARAVAAWGLELQTEVPEDYAKISQSLRVDLRLKIYMYCHYTEVVT